MATVEPPQATETAVGEEADGFRTKTIDASEASWWRRLGAGATHYPFVHRSRYYFVISFLVIVAGAAALSARGLNFGISFKGGVSWDVPSATLTVAQASKIVAHAGVTQATVVTLGSHSARTVEIQAGLTKLSGAARTAKENQVASLLAAKAHLPSRWSRSPHSTGQVPSHPRAIADRDPSPRSLRRRKSLSLDRSVSALKASSDLAIPTFVFFEACQQRRRNEQRGVRPTSKSNNQCETEVF